MTQLLYTLIQCDAIRSEHFENGQFHEHITCEPHVQTSLQVITFARHEYE